MTGYGHNVWVEDLTRFIVCGQLIAWEVLRIEHGDVVYKDRRNPVSR